MYKEKNRYYKFSKISEARFRRLLKAYAMDLTASDAATLTRISIRSVNDIYLKIWRRIAEYCEEQSPYSGEIELNELVHHEDYMSRAQARQSIFEYIEVFYNRERRHAFLDYMTPVEFEWRYAGI
jgi:transposase InsO family protein